MPWSGAAGAQVFSRNTGAFSGASCWAQSDAAARGIRSDDHDTHDQDIADGINATLKRDGGNTASGNIRMGGFKLTGLAAGTAAGDSLRFEQLESGVLTTRGDMLYRSVAGPARLPKGTQNQFLRQGANDPSWATLGTSAAYDIGNTGAKVPLLNAGNGLTNLWGTTQNIEVYGGAVKLYLTAPDSVSGVWQNMQAFILTGGIHAGVIQSLYLFAGSGQTIYGTTSDVRLKHGRMPIDDSGDIVDRLKPMWFRWGDGEEGPLDFGFGAQEVYEVLPQAVVPGKGNPGEEDYVPWMMQHGRLEGVVIAELQSLRRRVAELEARA